MTRSVRRRAATVALLALLGGCGGRSTPPGASRLHVVVTTTVIAALARGVAGDRADVDALVPLGASPETFQPAPADIAGLRTAGVIVRNGAGLDGWLDHLLQSAANPAAILVTCTDGLPVRAGNPHLWLDPAFARAYVRAIHAAIVRADPAGAAVYARNAAAYDARLASLTARIARRVATLPATARDMIVFHDAWAYYDARFGLRTIGVIETSPGVEPSPATLGRLVDLARTHHLHAIFAEPEYNAKLVDSVARSAGIGRVAVLYDDSLATGATDYVKMLDLDTETIVGALR